MTHWPETGACCLVPETMTHLAGKLYRQKKTKINFNFTELSFFVLLYELKNTFVTSLHFFKFLFTNKRAVLYRLLRLTNHNSAFQPVSGTKLNML